MTLVRSIYVGWAMVALVMVDAAPLRAQGESGDEAAIKATLVAMWDAIEQEDLARYGSYLHPDFTAFGETDPYLAEGKERELRSYANYLDRADGVHTEMGQPQVTVNGDTAWITYYWTDWGTINGNRFSSRGKSTRIFVREDGKWLCIHGHYTLIP